MGLDITACSKIERITDLEKVENGDYSTNVRRTHPEFERASDIDEGYYDCVGEIYRFRAGSYSGYNFFRNTLSKAILGESAENVWEKDDEFKGKPMYEIINFSDCEGNIGPAVSKKLHKDFMENREKFVNYIKEFDEPNFYERIYDDFTKGFELASNEQGILIFH